MSKFGFNLRKWCSNDKKLLENIPTEYIEYVRPFFGEFIKTLGSLWNPSKDNFTIKTKEIITKKIVTKKQVAYDCGQIFDPLGMVNPVVVKAKILLQTLWTDKFDWDTKLPEHFSDVWNTFRNKIYLLNSLNIPRKIVIDWNYMDSLMHQRRPMEQLYILDQLTVATKLKLYIYISY